MVSVSVLYDQLLVVPTESLTNRVWLEWIRTSKARLVFRYEISDLFPTLLIYVRPNLDLNLAWRTYFHDFLFLVFGMTLPILKMTTQNLKC